MSEAPFVWTPKLTKKLFELRFENDWLFKKRKQPWHAFRTILLQNGFPEIMTINHVRKKWSYTYDSYKIAKKTKNKSWKYYKIFDRHFGKTQILDKYETWLDEWRLKLITCVSEAKEQNLDIISMWKHVEKSLRCQNLPSDCCIQDIKGLWHHLKNTFSRKHRIVMRKGESCSDWPLHNAMLSYYETYDQDSLCKIEAALPLPRRRANGRNSSKRHLNEDCKDDEYEFQWSKDITETFIQIRLQHDWLFREKKWVWNDLVSIMIEEYGFPKTLNNRDLCRKWTSTYSDYQKALATNNTSWVYYNLFKCYLGEGSFSLNPMNGWKEEWVFKLIQARTNLEHIFAELPDLRDQKAGWREVEKALRTEGLPLDHSLFDLPEIWTHLLKTYRWKRKFADKGMLTEHWLYFDAMSNYIEIQKSLDTNETKSKTKELNHRNKSQNHSDQFDDTGGIDDDDDNFDDDMKLFDLKQKMRLKPKIENVIACRACNAEDGTYNIFEPYDEQGLLDLAHKLSVIAGIEIDKADSLPKQICFNCLKELENAYSFRRKCQEADKEHRNNISNSNNSIPNSAIKTEMKLDHSHNQQADETEKSDYNEFDTTAFDNECPSDADLFKVEIKPLIKKETKRVIRKKKKQKKDASSYKKMCEICGKRTNNLKGHLDAHSVGKSYSCDVCDKKFKFKSGLQIHKASHDPTPKKTCEVCGKAFHIIAQYRRHFVYHANERKFSCETCGKRFNTIDILRVHMRMHTDERPFSCQDCGKTFRTAGCVSRHKRIVHKKIIKMTST